MSAMPPPDTFPAPLQPLLQPHRFPGTVRAPIRLIETHISWVLLADEHAYKIKKPLRLAFLDFSTLALRKRYCDEELRLNRRFAPDIYLGVVDIHDVPGFGLRIGTADGPVVEHAVQMRRFDESGRLDRVSARGELRAAHLSDLAETVAAFHDTAAVTEGRFGSPAQVLAPALDNFHDLVQLLPPGDDGATPRRLAALRAWTEQQHRALASLMSSRQRAGRVRECHGDLHLANMVLISGRVRLFDCLEFNDELRWIDVANEIAFTYVDLLDHGQAGLANWFVDELLSRSGDYEAARLLPFYAVYRALVRAKVAAIRAGQQQGPGRQRQLPGPARDAAPYGEAMAYIAQAEQLVAPRTPRLIITHGLAGCGKTFASNALLQSDDPACARTLRLRSDVERRRLFGLQRNQRSGADIDAGIYDANAHQRTYTHLQDTARLLLRAGWSVIVDAAFLRRSERDDFHALADACGAGFAILAPQADTDELRRRITARQASGKDASEATLEVLDRQLQWIEPLGEDERACVLG
jgi:aminoglycoside phosphotransferase family enzyme/predicted kinase